MIKFAVLNKREHHHNIDKKIILYLNFDLPFCIASPLKILWWTVVSGLKQAEASYCTRLTTKFETVWILPDCW